MPDGGVRVCPDCGSEATHLVQRGLAGPTNETDQYYRCLSCGSVTYEILSCTTRDIRLGRIEPGRLFRHDGKLYLVRRVLRAGVNEYLVYLRPAADPSGDEPRRSRLLP